ncbi:MAG TPA: FliH/SctL family protein, partial [Desulfobacteria bacterium]|nr:FliH/SctL family protein [Desulfobacteria bacterium]
MSIKGRVVKGCTVEINHPVIVDFGYEQFVADCSPVTDLNTIETAAAVSPDPTDLAEAEAKEIVAAAKVEADELIRTAKNQVESLKRETIASVRAEILPQAQAQAAKILTEAKEVNNLAEKVLANEFAKADEQLLHLAIQIAERLVRSALAVEPQRILALVNELALWPKKSDDMCLHLSPEDAQRVSELIDQAELPWTLVCDQTLVQGDVCLEHNAGIYNARVTAELDRLETALREELIHD